MHKPPIIAVTMGDPCGIGPEVILRALGHSSVRRQARFIIIGSADILRAVARRFRLDDSFVREMREVASATRAGDVAIHDACILPKRFAACGRATPEGGRASLACIRAAVAALRAGDADALVTAPINKHAIALAGEDWPGHTELLGALAGGPFDRAQGRPERSRRGGRPVMMMVGGGLRAALVTTHCALRDVPALVTRKRVLDTIRIVAGDLRRSFGIARARIAVCGLNPHAGESGRFGAEEKRRIAPAVQAARKAGIRCDGPLPADVVFHQMLQGRYDAIVAMYHDQANIPVKTLAFETGANVTLGLPIVRTSPDHGTAYDIAPKGCADDRSMRAAIALAIDICRNRQRD